MMKKKVFIILLIFILCISIFFMVNTFKNKSYSEKYKTYDYYMSTKYNKSYIRTGPSKEYPIVFIYKKKYIPFFVTQEKDGWYKIKDYSNQEGWIHKSQIVQNKSAIVIKDINLKKENILIKKNTIVTVDHCVENKHCYIEIEINNNKTINAVIEKNILWGI